MGFVITLLPGKSDYFYCIMTGNVFIY